MTVSLPKLIISSYDDLHNPYYAGGGAAAVHAVARRLANHFSVTVITGSYRHSHDEFVDNVFYHRIGFSFLGPRLGQLIFHFYLPFLVKRLSYQVWIESFTPPFSTSFLQLFTSRPVIGLAHMLCAEDMERKYKLPFHLIENLGLKTYKYLIVTSNYIKAKVLQANPHLGVAVIPNGLDLVSLSKKTSIPKYNLYLGRIEINQKGLDLLLAAYSHITPTLPLYIAGSGSHQEEATLRKLVQSYHLSDSIKLLGRVSPEQKPGLFAKASTVIIPSRYENFSLVALESLAAGIRPITFAIPGLAWIPSELATKVTPFDIDALSHAIQESVKTPANHLFSSAAKRFSSSYSWDFLTKEYLAFIHQIIKSHD